jgi:hypothetical protein
MRVCRNGIELRSDGRLRERLPNGYAVIVHRKSLSKPRGKIRAWSVTSARRLAFITANADLFFRSHLTLTYRAVQESWESVGDRNLRFVKRCRADLHRFLRCIRREIGEYLWVREFQQRGAVHFHVLSELEVAQERAAAAWCRATNQAHDEAVLRHGVQADAIRSQNGARSYVSRYIGKERQKELPEGVDGAGRWWGRSRGLRLAVLEDIVWLDRSEGVRRPKQLRIVRILRRFIEKTFRRRYPGGAFVDYGGKLAAKLGAMAQRLREHYGWSPGLTELLESHGWDLVPEVSHRGRERLGLDEGDSYSDPEDSGARRGKEAGSDGRGVVQEEICPGWGGVADDEGDSALVGCFASQNG